MLNKTQESMKDEILTELKNGAELNDIKERDSEFIESHLPVYNNDVIKEWAEMPSEYDDRGAQEMGNADDYTIIRLMTLDLWLYYYDLFQEVINEVENELEGAK